MPSLAATNTAGDVPTPCEKHLDLLLQTGLEMYVSVVCRKPHCQHFILATGLVTRDANFK